jgi:hypothetical protein
VTGDCLVVAARLRGTAGIFMMMTSAKTLLIELLLAGFFAIACIRAHVPAGTGHVMSFLDFFRLTDRLERLKRSRWQWFSMVALLLILRLQQQLPLILEAMVLVQLLVFLALPVSSAAKHRAAGH